MSELHALYYSTAAPFKAVRGANRASLRERLLQTCFDKAVKHGFTNSNQPSNRSNCSHEVDTDGTAIVDSLENSLPCLFYNERANNKVWSLCGGWIKKGISNGACNDCVNSSQHNDRWGYLKGVKFVRRRYVAGVFCLSCKWRGRGS